MPKKTWRKLLSSVGAASLALCATAAAAFPSIFPTGTTIYDPAKAWNGYVLFADPNGRTHLIDMAGNDVHVWNVAGFPSEILDPALTHGEKGHLLVQTEDGPGPFGGIFNNRSIGELNWQGDIVWRWNGADGKPVRQNHDWARLPSGNTLIIATRDRNIPSLSKLSVADQVIQEIGPDGKVVWEWQVADHLQEFGFTEEGMKALRAELADGDKSPGFLTINDMAPIGPNKWFDAGDQRFNPDNIVIDSRMASFIAIIDRKSGKVVWRIGPDWNQPKLRPVFSTVTPRPVDQTSGQHDAHIIPKGLPGEGDLLVFDNEAPSGFPPTHLSMFHGSRVLEINPVTKEVVWQYTAADSDRAPWTFASSFISSARRLPNGNTLIDEGMNGRFFQVTPKGEIVWEYVSPYFGRQDLYTRREVSTNWVFRAQPVPYEWVPDGTPHSEQPTVRIDITRFRVPPAQP
ncbi:MAG TPA: aryl-sulfate sulfotransferase [Caulobacteraceae bacterium]|nr:aryl-sulfate sulfotransferase [Caulobacteraceae bacterium]